VEAGSGVQKARTLGHLATGQVVKRMFRETLHHTATSRKFQSSYEAHSGIERMSVTGVGDLTRGEENIICTNVKNRGGGNGLTWGGNNVRDQLSSNAARGKTTVDRGAECHGQSAVCNWRE